MTRITKNDLQIKLDCINKTTRKGCDYHQIPFNELELNYASIYGGWQLTDNNGSHIVKHRIPAKQMYEFLDGFLNGIIAQFRFTELERNN
jgi:hypothetical protein